MIIRPLRLSRFSSLPILTNMMFNFIETRFEVPNIKEQNI